MLKTSKDQIYYEVNEIYHSRVINKVLNKITKKGKKDKVEFFFHKTILLFKKHKCHLFLRLFYLIECIRPLIEMIPVRKRGRNYEVGAPANLPRQYKKAVNWISQTILLSKYLSLYSKICNEFINLIFYKKGLAFFKRKNEYKRFIKNRAYVHFR